MKRARSSFSRLSFFCLPLCLILLALGSACAKASPLKPGLYFTESDMRSAIVIPRLREKGHLHIVDVDDDFKSRADYDMRYYFKDSRLFFSIGVPTGESADFMLDIGKDGKSFYINTNPDYPDGEAKLFTWRAESPKAYRRLQSASASAPAKAIASDFPWYGGSWYLQNLLAPLEDLGFPADCLLDASAWLILPDGTENLRGMSGALELRRSDEDEAFLLSYRSAFDDTTGVQPSTLVAVMTRRITDGQDFLVARRPLSNEELFILGRQEITLFTPSVFRGEAEYRFDQNNEVSVNGEPAGSYRTNGNILIWRRKLAGADENYKAYFRMVLGRDGVEALESHENDMVLRVIFP